MARTADSWYVRLPDGRVVRAKSTKALRYHIRTGRIPVAARVRRDPAEDWVALEWTQEFADLMSREAGKTRPEAAPNYEPAVNNLAKVKNDELRTLGVRGLVQELLSALDSTLNRVKLRIAAGAGLVLGMGVALYTAFFAEAEPPWSWAGLAALAFLAAMGTCLAIVLLTQMTFVELSRLRQARPKEIRVGLWRHTLHLLLAYVAVGGVLAGALFGLRTLSSWLSGPGGPGLTEAALVALLAIRLLLEILAWPILGLTLLFCPIVVIEECSFIRAVREAYAMAHRHPGRVFLYEALAFVLGIVLTLPFMFPVGMTALSIAGESGLLSLVGYFLLRILGGLALTPLLAYLSVANVFIYLNLRYEFFQGGK